MKKNLNEVFSTNLRNALYMAGKTQAELAKAVNVTEVSVSEWINGANSYYMIVQQKKPPTN